MDNLNSALGFLGKKIDELNSSIKDALRSVEREIPDTSKIDTKLDKIIGVQEENTEELQKGIEILKTSLINTQTETIKGIAEQQKTLQDILTTFKNKDDSNVLEALDSISKQLTTSNLILEAVNKIVIKISEIKPKDSSDKILKGLNDVVSAINAIDFPIDLTGLDKINDSIKNLQQDVKQFNTRIIEDKLTELINATGGAKITVSGTAPQNPSIGDLWCDTG